MTIRSISIQILKKRHRKPNPRLEGHRFSLRQCRKRVDGRKTRRQRKLPLNKLEAPLNCCRNTTRNKLSLRSLLRQSRRR
jgi:hypothetical protein